MKDLTIEEFEVMLCSTGYLPPRNEDELLFFNEMYGEYESRLSGRHVDIEAIFNGSCRIVSDSNSTSECSRITYAKSDSEYSMAARNFGKLPKDILDKMRSQHNLFDEES